MASRELKDDEAAQLTGTAIALFVVPCGDTVSIIDIQKVTPLVY